MTRRSHRFLTVARGARLGAALLLLAPLAFGFAGTASGESAVPKLSPEEYENAKLIYFDRCSGCHGALRKGATGPNITDEKMTTKTLAKLQEVIFEGTDAGMPGWGRTDELDQSQTQLMAKFLQMKEIAHPVPEGYDSSQEDPA